MERGTGAGYLHDQGEDVEPADRLAAGPAEGQGEAGDLDGCRVPGDGTVGGLVTGIPDQLRIENPRTWPVGGVGREHGDYRPDPSGVRRFAQMYDRLGGDVRCCGHLAAIADP